VMYNGEELGMQNGEIALQDAQDPAGEYTPGIGMGRDPQRTPMQWSAEVHAGFSDGEPWLPVSADYPVLNVKSETADEDSFLNLYKALLTLRRDDFTLREGDFQLSSSIGNQVLTYRRQSPDGTYIVALNFSADVTNVDIGVAGDIVTSTHPASLPFFSGAQLILQPYGGVLIRVI